MKVTVHGAGGGEVTGSAYLLQTREANVLVDFGLFQGPRKVENYNRIPKKGAFEKLDAVVLTHAHLDHTGRLPLLTRAGYDGPIYATPATIDFADLILSDSARLQKSDAERQNRRRERMGQPLLDPLYEQQDVERLRPLYKKLGYDQPTPLAPGITVRAVEAGHMLGSASLELTVEDEGKKKAVIFSGDLGLHGAPLHRDYVPFQRADFVFMESTYGDRDHRSLKETAVETRKVIKKAVAAGAKILVPVFAVGRTQLLLYLLAGAFKRGTLSPFPIYIDSPMAIKATELYGKHVELFDERSAGDAAVGGTSPGTRHRQVLSFGRRLPSAQRRQGPMPDHGRSGQVYRRTNPASLSAQSGSARNDSAVRWLPGAWLPGPNDRGRKASGHYLR